MEVTKVSQITDDLKKYTYGGKDSDYITLTEWANGEGYDIDINGKLITLSSDELEAITDISYNLKAFEEYDDVYYTTKEAVSIYDVYIPFEENLDADWLPYNCTIVEYDIFFKDGEYYYEGEEPDDSVRGERTFEYKEGKLVKQGFKPY